MTEDVQMGGGVGRSIGLLGGEATLQAKVLNATDAHELLLKGLPVGSVLHLVSKAAFLEDGDALKRSIGISLSTLLRRRAKIDHQRLCREQSDRCWRFVDLSQFRSGHLRAILAIKETGYGSNTQRRVQAGCSSHRDDQRPDEASGCV